MNRLPPKISSEAAVLDVALFESKEAETVGRRGGPRSEVEKARLLGFCQLHHYCKHVLYIPLNREC